MTLIQNYPYDVAIVAGAALIIIVLALNNRIDALKKAALYAVTVAEENWGSKTGEIKYAEVVVFLKDKFKILTILLTDKQLSDLIEKALTRMKEILKEKEKLEEK